MSKRAEVVSDCAESVEWSEAELAESGEFFRSQSAIFSRSETTGRPVLKDRSLQETVLRGPFDDPLLLYPTHRQGLHKKYRSPRRF